MCLPDYVELYGLAGSLSDESNVADVGDDGERGFGGVETAGPVNDERLADEVVARHGAGSVAAIIVFADSFRFPGSGIETAGAVVAHDKELVFAENEWIAASGPSGVGVLDVAKQGDVFQGEFSAFAGYRHRRIDVITGIVTPFRCVVRAGIGDRIVTQS